MNTARSAVSTILNINGLPAGKHPLVCRFLKGVFQQKPALPRYNVTWDINIMLNYLKSLSPVHSLDLQTLSQKLLMLCLILSGQRGQTIHLFDTRNMTLSNSRASFTLGDIVKTTAPGRHTGQITFLAFAPDRRLCIITVLREYLKRSHDIRGETTQLFITLRKPHGPATRDTLRRWAKITLSKAGVNVDVFRPHSVRSASTSLAAASQLSLDTIMRAAGWYQENTFNKYYNLPIEPNFGQHVLMNAKP